MSFKHITNFFACMSKGHCNLDFIAMLPIIKNHFNSFNNNQYIQNGYHRQIINYTADNF